MKYQTLAIIPARSGSKRIPHKNIKSFLGVPIIKYSIDKALEAGCFDEIMVSTDHKQIARLARVFQASIPFLRSREASTDFATTADVILEVLSQYSKVDKTFAYVCCIYPAAPFITAKKLLEGYYLLKKHDADAVIPVVQFSYPPQKLLSIQNGFLKILNPSYINNRSQEFKPLFHDAGLFYWLKVKSFLKQKKIFMKKSAPLKISEMESQDINTPADWNLAELKYKIVHHKKFMT